MRKTNHTYFSILYIFLFGILLSFLQIPSGFSQESTPNPIPETYDLSFSPGPSKSIHTPLYSPYGKKLELVPTDVKNVAGIEHLFSFIGVGQSSNQLDAQTFVISRKGKGRPYTLLTLDTDQDGDFGDEKTIEITASESRGNYWSSFQDVELTAQYVIKGKVHQEPYPVSMWVVVEDTTETPEIIRFSRKGFRIVKVKVSDMDVAIVLSDANNDGIFNEEDWWILRPYDTQEKLRDARTVDDFAWLNGEAWKLSLADEAGLNAKLIRFDPGITEEQDLESRDLYLADKKAAKAKEPVPFSKNYEETLALAKEENKPYFIKFEAVWCGPCKLMDKYVYASKAVVKAAQDVHCVKVDTDDYPALKQKYGVNALPTGILFDATGNELKRFEGYRSVKAMEKFFGATE